MKTVVALALGLMTTFAAKVRESGMDGLIKSLVDKNRQGSARLRSDRMGEFYLAITFRN